MLITDFKIEKIPNSVAFTPYYGFGGSEDRSMVSIYPIKKESRIAHSVYIIKCIMNLKQYTDNVWVSVQNEKDYLYIKSLNDYLNLNINVYQCYCNEGVLHPVSFLLEMQAMGIHEGYDKIIYTECDQLLYINPKVLDIIDNETTLSFNRVMRVYFPDSEIFNKWDGLESFELDNELYVNQLVKEHIDPNYDSDLFYNFITNGGSYGAAYICSKEVFEKTNFILTKQNPCERASFHIYDASKYMVKTKKVDDAMALHLSGMYENFKFKGLDINDYPNLW